MVGLGVLVRDPALARESLGQASAGEEHLATWLQAATDDGRLYVKQPELAAEVFWGMVAGVFVWPQLFHGPMETDHQKKLLTELISVFLARYQVLA